MAPAGARAATTSAPSGPFSVVNHPSLGEKQQRELVNDDELTEDTKEALEADEFIICGKASVEKYDDDRPPQKLRMESFEEQMPSFLDEDGGGIISRRHKDIPVGEPLRSYSLDEPTTLEVGGESYDFDAGTELRTEVDPDFVPNDTEDELWIVANLRNDSEIARETRLGALTGDLDGFSVTVFCKEWKNTEKGQLVTDMDWHSVTIGPDEQIKNDDSRFGVATFKLGGVDFPARAALDILGGLPQNMSNADSGSSDFWRNVKQKAEERIPDDDEEDDFPPEDGNPEEEKEQAEEPDAEADDPPGDGIDEGEVPDSDEKEEVEDEDEIPDSDADAVVEKVEQELGEEDAETLRKAMEGPAEPVEPPEPDEGEEVEDEELEEELKQAAAEAAADAADAAVSEKLDSIESTLDTVREKLDEAATVDEVDAKLEEAREEITTKAADVITDEAEDLAEGLGQKAVTGSTPSPTGGSEAAQDGYRQDIQQRFGSAGKGAAGGE